MTDNAATWWIRVEREGDEAQEHLSNTDDLWSFGALRQRLVADVASWITPKPPMQWLKNDQADPTFFEKKRRQLEPSAVPLRRFKFGRRRFPTLYQWEGVVEDVNGDGFRARLTPYGTANGDKGAIEYADFDYEDLAEESDLERVVEGAVFYWTIGRSRDRAGTVTNASLLRFRRIPPPSRYQRTRAKMVAEVVLRELDGD
jgi:hypothetical protein